MQIFYDKIKYITSLKQLIKWKIKSLKIKSKNVRETRLIHLTCQYMTTHLPGLELFTLPDHLSSPPPIPRFQWGSCYSISSFLCSVLQNIVCRFDPLLLAIALSDVFDLRILITRLVSSNFFWYRHFNEKLQDLSQFYRPEN